MPNTYTSLPSPRGICKKKIPAIFSDTQMNCMEAVSRSKFRV